MEAGWREARPRLGDRATWRALAGDRILQTGAPVDQLETPLDGRWPMADGRGGLGERAMGAFVPCTRHSISTV